MVVLAVLGFDFIEADASMREAVQVKYLSMTDCFRPMASKICAP